MDLEAFARANGLASRVDKVRAWRRELSDDDDGRAVRRNLRRDTQLEATGRGRAALKRLVRRVAARAADSPSTGSPWLKHVLEAQPQQFLCQGKAVRIDASTDLVARVTSLRTVVHHLFNPSVVTTALKLWGHPTMAAGPNRAVLLRMGRRFLSTSARASYAIDASRTVRGTLPLVFVSPEIDRQHHWPTGTAIPDINAVLGLPPSAPDVDLCVLRFRRSTLDCHGHVPTGIDAFSHQHFLPSSPGSAWGQTRDLRGPVSPPQLGVRECVIAAFPAGLIQDFEVVEA